MLTVLLFSFSAFFARADVIQVYTSKSASGEIQSLASGGGVPGKMEKAKVIGCRWTLSTSGPKEGFAEPMMDGKVELILSAIDEPWTVWEVSVPQAKLPLKNGRIEEMCSEIGDGYVGQQEVRFDDGTLSIKGGGGGSASADQKGYSVELSGEGKGEIALNRMLRNPKRMKWHSSTWMKLNGILVTKVLVDAVCKF